MEKKSFWNTKPVLQYNETASVSCNIEDLSNRKLYNKQNPINLPNIMKWVIIDTKNKIDNVCEFLNEYCDQSPKIKFTPDLLKLWLGHRNVLLGIVKKTDSTLCGIIGCSIYKTTIYDKTNLFAHVVLLCAHNMYRKTNITQTMINELIRYLYVTHKISYGLFSSTKKLFQPVSVYSTYIRPLNYIKLCDAGFIKKTTNKIMLVKKEENINYISMKESHLNDVYDVYSKYIIRFNLCCKYTKEEFFYLLFNNLVKSYVIMENDKIVDFVSYYTFQYEKDINVAQLFLYTSNTECYDELICNLLNIISDDVDMLLINDIGTIGETILTSVYKNTNEDSDQETYTKIYEYGFLKQNKKYVNFFNWKSPYLPSNLISLFIT